MAYFEKQEVTSKALQCLLGVFVRGLGPIFGVCPSAHLPNKLVVVYFWCPFKTMSNKWVPRIKEKRKKKKHRASSVDVVHPRVLFSGLDCSRFQVNQPVFCFFENVCFFAGSFWVVKT